MRPAGGGAVRLAQFEVWWRANAGSKLREKPFLASGTIALRELDGITTDGQPPVPRSPSRHWPTNMHGHFEHRRFGRAQIFGCPAAQPPLRLTRVPLPRLCVPPAYISAGAAELCLVGRDPKSSDGQRAYQLQAEIAVGETVILLHPPLPLVGVSIAMKRERQQNDSLADG